MYLSFLSNLYISLSGVNTIYTFSNKYLIIRTTNYRYIPVSASNFIKSFSSFPLFLPFWFFIGVTGLVSLFILSRIHGLSGAVFAPVLVRRTSGWDVSSPISSGSSPANEIFFFKYKYIVKHILKPRYFKKQSSSSSFWFTIIFTWVP